MKITSRAVAVSAGESRERADGLLAWLRDYGATRINSRLIDERRTLPPHVVLDLGNHGCFGLQVEEKYGGLALRAGDVGRVLEQAAAIDLSLGTFLLTSLFPGIRPIAAFGSASVKDAYLPELAAGRALAGYAQTEPGAGTHFAAMAARAEGRSDGSWRVSGDKVWIGNATWARVLTTLAQDQSPEGRRRGLTAFALPTDRPGVVLGAELVSLGMRGMVQSEVCFREVEAGEADVVGTPGRGLEVGVDSMSFSRFAIAATCVGAMKRAAQMMQRYASRREIATGRLADHPVTRIALGEAIARIAACEGLLALLTRGIDDGDGACAELFAVCKLVASEFSWQTVDRAVQVLGSRGYDEETGLPQLLRDVRVTRIFEGASEPLEGFVGAQALAQRSDLLALLREDLGAGDLAGRLEEGVAAMRARQLGGDPLPRPWLLALAGRALCAALVAGVLRAEAERLPPVARGAAMSWAEGRFDLALASAASGARDEALLDPGVEYDAVVSGYAASIGDVEQTLPGERKGLDPLLRKSS